MLVRAADLVGQVGATSVISHDGSGAIKREPGCWHATAPRLFTRSFRLRPERLVADDEPRLVEQRPGQTRPAACFPPKSSEGGAWTQSARPQVARDSLRLAPTACLPSRSTGQAEGAATFSAAVEAGSQFCS